MPKPSNADPERSKTATFGDVTKEIARRNEEHREFGSL